MDTEITIQDARKEAALAMHAGRNLAERSRATALTPKQRGRLCADVLGSVLHKPADFWGAACAIEANSEGTGGDVAVLGEVIGLEVRYACARMTAGDMDFVRESLLGQAQWASLLAVKLAAQGEIVENIDKAAILYKLAMQAQRQAAQALATAAALNKLVDADSVQVS